MRLGRATLIAALALTAQAATYAEANSSAAAYDPVCIEPQSPLKAGSPDVNGDSVYFTESGMSYQLDVYSGYARIKQAGSDVYCVRNEIINLGQRDIRNLYWSDGRFVFDPVRPNNRMSFVRTVGPMSPILDSVVLGAFKNVQIETKAFKRRVDATANWLHLVADEGQGKKLDASPAEAIKFPVEKVGPVGAEFINSETKFGVSSSAWSDAKTLHFKLGIDSPNADAGWKIFAPFALALEKAASPSDIPGLIKEYGQSVSLPEGGFAVERNFSWDSTTPLYLIEQPVTIQTDGGHACLLVPSYSPVEIPPELLTCE